MINVSALWTLVEVNQPDSMSWSMHIRYRPDFASRALAERLGGWMERTPLPGDPQLLAQIELLVREVFSQVPAPQPILESGMTFQPTAADAFLVHYMGSFAEPPHTSEVIEWVRHLKLGAVWAPGSPQTGVVRIDALSSASRAAIRQLDALAIDRAYRHFGDQLSAIADVDREALPPIRKARVFISYRYPHLPIAERLHGLMSAYARSVAFDPFLDRHHMRLGLWKVQLLRRIEETDVFMAVVTPDYAAAGSVSREEFEKGKEVAARRRLKDFFAPVFVGNVKTAVAEELKDFHALLIQDSTELDDNNQKLQDFLRAALATGLSRSL